MSETRTLIVPETRRRAARSHGAPGRRVGWLHFVLVPLAVLWLVPIIMVVGLSMMPPNNPGTQFFGLFPAEFSVKNYLTIWDQNPILLHLLNSLLITVPSVLLVCLLLTVLFVVISQVKINVTNAYAGSIAWSNFFSRLTHSHPGRVVWLVFNVVVALLFGIGHGQGQL